MRLENAFAKHHEARFQDLFADIMERAHPGNYQRTRAAGSRGDVGFDGYMREPPTGFAVYAPRVQKSLKAIEDKIEGDFRKARESNVRITHWVFVHNQADIHPGTTVLLRRLQEETGIRTDIWGFEALWKVAVLVDHSVLEEILPIELAMSASVCNGTDATQAEDTGEVHVASGVGSHAASRATQRVLLEHIEAQGAEIRKYLDAEGQALWDATRDHLADRSFAKAIAAGRELADWLAGAGRRASSEIRGRVYVLLADLAVIEDFDSAVSGRSATARARRYYEQARDAYGSDIAEEDAERLVSLSAKLRAVDGDYEGALAETEQYPGPNIVSLRLALFIEKGRFGDAVAWLGSRNLHERWCDLAVIVHVEHGELERAREILSWARSRPKRIEHRCAVSFAKALTIVAQQAAKPESRALPGRLHENARGILEEAIGVLQPVFGSSELAGTPQTGLEAEALELAVVISHWLGDYVSRRRYAELLGKSTPVSIAFARAVQAGYVDTSADLPGRLRQDHPALPEAAELAAWIEGVRLGRVRAAIETVKTLTRSADPQQQVAYCGLLIELAGQHDPPLHAEVDTFVAEILGGAHRLVRLRTVARMLSTADRPRAVAILDELRDESDPFWWQLYARSRYDQGDMADAAEGLMAASRLVPDIGLIRWAIRVAEQADRPELVDEAVRTLIAISPDDEQSLFRVAMLFVEQARFSEAAVRFRRLHEKRPDETAYALNLAVCLRNDGQPSEALAVLEPLCGAIPSVVPAIVMRATILCETGKPDRAFRSLQALQDSHWDDPQFLRTYVQCAFAASQDAYGEQAFNRMIALKREGGVPENVIWPASVDQVAESMRQAVERQSAADDDVMHGKFPWLLAERLRGHVPVVGWRFRTQHRIVRDDQRSRAAFAIYATNRFTVRSVEHGRPWLEDIHCAPANTNVVADVSALLTLASTNLLDHAIRYFGRISVPSLYIPAMLTDRARIGPLQPSKGEEARKILESVDQGRIQILPESKSLDAIPELDDYSDAPAEARRCYRLCDLFTWLRKSGKISTPQYDRAMRVANAAPAPGIAFNEAVAGGIIARVDTLRTIVAVELFETVVRSLRVFVTADEVLRLRREARDALEQERVLAAHDQLADRLTDRSAFPRLPATADSAPIGEQAHPDVQFAFLAANAALHHKLPLFADDRVCQAVVLNARVEDAFAAFGTDAFLETLLESDTKLLSSVTHAYEQMLKWRYRFILPPPSVLAKMARSYAEYLPGASLIGVAHYAHDCMRDPGLFAGRERTIPGSSVAFRLYSEWLRVIAAFLIDVWIDEAFPEAAKATLTRWAVSELVPSPPQNVHAFFRRRMAEITPQALLGTALSMAIRATDEALINRALVQIAHCLGLTEEDYVRLVGETVNVRWSDIA